VPPDEEFVRIRRPDGFLLAVVAFEYVQKRHDGSLRHKARNVNTGPMSSQREFLLRASAALAADVYKYLQLKQKWLTPKGISQ
jgi:hypothetical protein